MVAQESNIPQGGSDLPRATVRCELLPLLSTRVFRALADPNRVAILACLAEGGDRQTVGEVARCCPVDLSVVSRHLVMLRDAGIVEAEKKGREVYYSVRVSHLVKWLRSLADALESCCPGEDDVCKARTRKLVLEE